MTRRRAAPALLAAVAVAVAACSLKATSPNVTMVPPPTTATTLDRGPVTFSSSVGPVSAVQLSASWRPGCPLPVDQLRAIDATYWGFDGRVHRGRIVVGAAQVAAVTSVLLDLFAARYQIHQMEPVDVYGGSDDASVLADNTSGFNCRLATGGTGWSEHAFGRAIDLNPLENPYVHGTTVLPPQSARFLDRTRTDQGVIHAGDAAVQAFAKVGWPWGGQWPGPTKDYQHFSSTGH